MSGANVQLVTKSGTREFHGLGSHFKRHEQFNANNFFNNRLGVEKPRSRLNVYSYSTWAGPSTSRKYSTKSAKSLFFWSQEFSPRSNSLPIAQLTVPTALERAGDFSQTFELDGRQVPIVDPLTRQPVPGNRLPASRIDPNGQALLSLLPLRISSTIPSRAAATTMSSGPIHPRRSGLKTLRIDYNVRGSTTCFLSPAIGTSRPVRVVFPPRVQTGRRCSGHSSHRGPSSPPAISTSSHRRSLMSSHSVIPDDLNQTISTKS